MYKNKINFKIVNLILLLVLFILFMFSYSSIASIIGRIIKLTGPFIVGFALAYGLNPFVHSIEKKGIKKRYAVLIVMLLFIAIFAGTVVLAIPIVITQLSQIITELIKLVNELSLKYDLNLSSALDNLKDVSKLISDIGVQAGSYSLAIINSLVSIISFGVLGLISCIYFLYDMDSIRSKFKAYLKKKNMKTFRYFQLLDNEISNYFRGYWTFMFVQFVEYTIIFYLVGHPYFLILGILAAITGIFPYIGGLITNIFACITAALISPQLLALCLIVIVVAPQIDSYIISPRIYGETNDIHPLLNIFTVFICGAIWGIVGVIIALPLLLIIMTTIKFYNKDINSKINDIKVEMRTETE